LRILGIDPGLVKTGWGIIEISGNNISYIGSGLVKTNATLPLYVRLAIIDSKLKEVILAYKPENAAIEETFMNNNAASALKLGQARGVAMVSAAREGLEVTEYAANLVKKSIVGTGHATKNQIAMMVKTLLPKSGKLLEDEADALAIAICHYHHQDFKQRTYS
jgi:crossover junction endodeoxyribonuclease RuvC